MERNLIELVTFSSIHILNNVTEDLLKNSDLKKAAHKSLVLPECLTYPFLIVNHSNILKAGAVLRNKGLVSCIVVDIMVAVLFRSKFNHEAMGKPSLRQVST